jgi:Mg-chelatase subunit ChlD
MAQFIPTSSITFVETEHGRLRRKQRGIDKKDLQQAKKYGTRLPARSRLNGDPTSKYTYRGIVYIVNDETGEEVTSYAIPIKLDLIPVTKQMVQDHERARNRAQSDLDSWTSNTVLVVDRSGSMKKGDVWGARNRLSSVWLSTALDFIAHRLESGDAIYTDIISIITLEEHPVAVIHNQPTTWVLYNKIASIYNSQLIEPRGHGPFLPSLQLAEKLLLSNPCASCAVGVLFLSDGKPSDTFTSGLTSEQNMLRREKLICEQVENLAKQFGRRLTFQAVGLGDSDFSTLKLMVEAAADYGAKAQLNTPSMSSL